tara:strand:- start:4930 stop:5379 length:450 start_codon:yes stop_codon:yes gene_type:complete
MDQLSLFSTEEILKVEDGKTCTKCNKYLPFSSFQEDAKYISGRIKLRRECKECRNHSRYIAKKLREEEGPPPENYVCPICKKNSNSSSTINGNEYQGVWALDHCHDTETFRGYLCHKCNKGLGHFNDSPEYLNNAIEYLNKHLRKVFLT